MDARTGTWGQAGPPPRAGGGSHSGTSAVKVSGLGRRFGEVWAVEDLSFEVHEGELFGLVGPDGAGKTTTLRILAGVLPPTSGQVFLHGVDVVRDPEGAKPFLAYMSQQFGLYEDLTVLENIHFYADLYRVPKRDRPPRLERLFAFSQLGPWRHTLAGKLSGGMKQKLFLCCALIHRPRVLILDEPTFGVDPLSRRDLWLILHEMVAEGVTAVVSTSYLDEAERCDRVAFLHRGRLMALDTPPRLLASLPGRVVALWGKDPRRIRDALKGRKEVLGVALFGHGVHALLGPEVEDLAVLGRILEEAGVAGVERMEPAEVSLEDVFLHLAGGDPHG